MHPILPRLVVAGRPCDYQALAATFYEAKAYVEGPRGTDRL